MVFFTKLKDFIVNTSKDERIPSRDKKIIVAMVVLIISPIDLIPDWIPFLGQLDDIILLSIILDYFFRVLDSNVLLSHYPWGMKSFSYLRSIARSLNFFVPNWIKKRLWKYIGNPYDN